MASVDRAKRDLQAVRDRPLEMLNERTNRSVKLKNSPALYAHMFDVVMSKFNETTGEITNETISRHLSERVNNIKPRYSRPASDEKLRKHIHNSLLHEKQGFFHYARVDGHPITNRILNKSDQRLFEPISTGIKVKNQYT